MKIGLFLVNSHISAVDVSNPEKGNPGIGGTEFMFISLPYYYKKFLNDNNEFIYYAPNTDHLPPQFSARHSANCHDAYIKSAEDACDIFLWRPVDDENNWKLIHSLDNINLPVIAWVHNTLNQNMLDALAGKNALKRYVTVSQEQMDILRDHPIIKKTCNIYNGFDINCVTHSVIPKDPNMVVYTGSMIPAKGFGVLARIWKKVLEGHPAAQLYVIGSGSLYNREKKLGLWNVADEKFEAEAIRPCLSNEHGEKLPSVHFLGILGHEKNTYLSKAAVGIVNPSALTENCPGSALEFQASGTPVVSKADWGLLDTVIHQKTGLLGLTDEELVSNILFFLKDTKKSYQFGEAGHAFVTQKFNYESIIQQWESVFSEVLIGKANQVVPITQNILFRRKWLRELLRIAKHELYKDKIKLPFDYQNDSVKLLSIMNHINNTIKAFPNDITSQLRKMDEKNHLINEKNNQIENQLRKINEKNHLINEKNNQIENQLRKINEKNHLINEKNNQIENKRKIIDKKNRLLNEIHGTLKELTGISAVKHPLKKLQLYKKLINQYHQNKEK